MGLRKLRGVIPACATALLAFSACSGLAKLAPDEHLVAAPITARANVVLRSLVEAYGSRSGDWGGCMSPGCVQVWATQFGYRAGVRRDRDDLVELGEVTAGRQAERIRGLAWDALFGREVDPDDPAVFGFPALLVSGTLGERGFDAYLFERVLDEAIARRESAQRRERAGLAALLAASAALKESERDERLALARETAESAAGGGGETWRFLAWAAVAKASGEADDATRALAVLGETRYRFDDAGALVLPFEAADEILSRHLSMVHGLSDLAALTGDTRLHRGATSLLDHVFSDAWFDGAFLIHDRVRGPSRDVCSGCNFMALYLVDRLYGDSFVIARLPPLPRRRFDPAPRPPAPSPTAGALTLQPGTDGEPGRLVKSLAAQGVAGTLALRHALEPVGIDLRYRVREEPPGRMLAVDVTSLFGGESRYELAAGFDGEGVARLQIGAEPLIARITVRRKEPGTLDFEIELLERLPGP